MRRATLILLAMASVTMAAAQRPWVELDERRQQQILASKHISAQLRESYADIANVDTPTREALWHEVTTPTKDQRLASLYLYIYEQLRQSDGSTAQEDLTMLTAYPDYHLTAWQNEEHHYDIYNYAYNIATLAAHGQRPTTALLRPLQRRKLMRRHGEAIATLIRCATFAEGSISLGMTIEPDHTLPWAVERLPRHITAAEYHKVGDRQRLHSSTEQLTTELQMMVEECIRWDGSYNVTIEHTLGRDILIVEAHGDHSSHIAIVDSNGTTTTLPSPCYLLGDGQVYAIARHDGTTHILIAHIAKGCATLRGTIALGDVAPETIKCDNTGIYFEREGHYLHIPEL